MKHLIFICFLFLIPVLVQAQEIPDTQITFANRFKDAVANHNEKAIFKLLDKSYRKTQTKFLGGNKKQLLNELFGGNDMNSGAFVVIPIENITKIEIAEVQELNDGSYDYVFRIRDGQHDILASLVLIKKGKKYGFVGAVG